jgi:superfamily II DNA/RNA helicase
MAEDSSSARKCEEKDTPIDRSDTFLFKFARNLGRTARAIRDGSNWLFGTSSSATPRASSRTRKKKEEPSDVIAEEAAAGITADLEAAVKAAEEEPDEEEAAAGITADVEAAVKAAEEDEEDEVPPDVEGVVKAVEKETDK